MTDKITIERETLLPCPFCGDDGDKGRQEVTQMIEGRNKFARITCRACGAMCPEENWNRRAALAGQPAEPVEPVAKIILDTDGECGVEWIGHGDGLIVGAKLYYRAQPAPAAVPPDDLTSESINRRDWP